MTRKEQSGKVVLAYSGGLDTSIILKWLQQERGLTVVTFTADIGQGEETDEARIRAEQLGIREIFVEDLREEFVRDFVFPMFRANALYEGVYLLGTAIARPLIAKRLVEIAELTGAEAIAHGATGKGNDQVRFELGAYALTPDIRIIAPWREWDLNSRRQLLEYARQHDIPLPPSGNSDGDPPYSTDANLLHISYEGGSLEDPWQATSDDMWRRTTDPRQAPDQPEEVILSFQQGDPVAINGTGMRPAALLTQLNELGCRHGIGRADVVENRLIGMKARQCYETPGGTILYTARRAMESLTLDGQTMRLKDDLMPRYATLVYNGLWWSRERLALQKLVDETQSHVNGEVRLKLYKGVVSVTGRRSDDTLFDSDMATFEEGGDYRQADAEGFIRLTALRLRLDHVLRRKLTK